MKYMALKTLLALSSAFFSIQAAEVDNFYRRYAPLKDEKNTINSWANEEFAKALEKANKKSQNCDEKELFKQLKKSFKNHYHDQFTKRLYKAKGLDHRKIPFSQSIYQELTAIESVVIGFMGKIYDSASPIINFNGHQIGTDKFEHFFGRGRAYYNMIHVKKKTLKDAMLFGYHSEEKTLGSKTTGVMSYADLAANFRGLFFWNHILMQYSDPLELPKPAGPYVKCVDQKWVQNLTLDLSLYVDDSWDEAINCSKFKNKKIAQKVEKVQRQYAALDPEHVYSCPVSIESNENLKETYQPYAEWIINDGKTLVLKP